MIAEVIPYSRTIRGKDFFDYKIPPGLSVTRGNLVYVPFRSKKIVGLVLNIKDSSSAKKLKQIDSVIDNHRWLGTGQLEFLRWFADFYYISLATAFKTAQHPILKRPRATKTTVSDTRTNDSALKITKKAAETVLSATSEITNAKQNLIHYSQRADCLAFFRGLATNTKGHILIIVSEYNEIKAIQQSLPSGSIITFENEPSPSQLIALEKLLSNDDVAPKIIIGTKKFIFLDPKLFSVIILDQEEAKSHKHNQNPRYHTRTVLRKMHDLNNAVEKFTLVMTSQTPSLEIYSDKDKLNFIDIQRDWSADHIHIVDMGLEHRNKNYTWFSDALTQAIVPTSRTFLFLNRTGGFSVAVCEDCASLLKPDTTHCTECHSLNIKYKRKGTEQLEKELRELFPNLKILRVDSTQSDVNLTPAALQSADIIIGTEKVLRLAKLKDFDLIGILSIDHLLVYPHYQAQERVYQILRKLFASQRPVILQTQSPDNPVIKAALTNNYQAFYQNESTIRKLLHKPPFGEIFKLINTKTNDISEQTEPPNITELDPEIVIDRL